jgi:hypothetical protein
LDSRNIILIFVPNKKPEVMKYKVKLLDGHNARPDQVSNTGYLGNEESESIYTRGEALKKARMFKGKIELVGLSKALTKVSMTQIPQDALADWVVRQLQGREMFEDTDTELAEKIYSGDVFEAILCEYAELEDSPLYPQEKYMKQLDELAQMVDTEYVQLTNI